jgi:predicted ATPase
MSAKRPIERLTIQGFLSIRQWDRLQLGPLNVLIGANGAGKSNFINYFRMLGELIEGRLQIWAKRQGGADRVLSFGIKETQELHSTIEFGRASYRFGLAPTVDAGFTFVEESLVFNGSYHEPDQVGLETGKTESSLKKYSMQSEPHSLASICYHSIASWKVFHFHDTSETAGVKRLGSLHDKASLRADASNLAAFLYRLKAESPHTYGQIRKTVRLAIPFFDDFVLTPQSLPSGEEQIRLLWRQQGSDYALWPSQLSDGSIRFICLATALLQPDPPSTLIIDEPELGLHPYAITLLAALIRAASEQMQIIVSTQSISLINQFSLQDLIVVEREEGASTFRRLDTNEFGLWLEEYSVGDLWEKNVLGGRPG